MCEIIGTDCDHGKLSLNHLFWTCETQDFTFEEKLREPRNVNYLRIICNLYLEIFFENSLFNGIV